ncbi:MAG: hypothetical protein ACXV5I_08660 [Halobacteriota archaeon]
MMHVGTSKVTKLNAKANIVYPLIRLPKSCVDEIGKAASIFETQCGSGRALLVMFGETADGCEGIQPASEVIQLLPKVIQPDESNCLKSRVLELEKEIRELKRLLLLNESDSLQKTKKNGPGVIRTHDLRHVKAGDLGCSATFSDVSILGATTTRKASAPL